MKLLHATKAKYLFIALISMIACYTLLFIYTEINPPEIDNSPDKSPPETILFFVDIFPKKVTWINENNILIQEDSRVTIYSSQNRKSRTIYENTGNSEPVTIKSSWWTNSEILVAVENKDKTHILQYDPNGDKLKQQTLQNSDFIEIENDLVCRTTNFIIKSPDEIATTIEITHLDQGKNKETIVLKTHLTVKPLNCSKDKLILTPSNPVLEKNLYYWNPGQPEPQKIEMPEDTADIINQNLITDSTEVFYLEKEDPTNDKYKIQSTTLNNPDPDLASQIVTIQTFTSDENFLNVHPNNPLTSFALISELGELWILHIQDESSTN